MYILTMGASRLAYVFSYPFNQGINKASIVLTVVAGGGSTTLTGDVTGEDRSCKLLHTVSTGSCKVGLKCELLLACTEHLAPVVGICRPPHFLQGRALAILVSAIGVFGVFVPELRVFLTILQ